MVCPRVEMCAAIGIDPGPTDEQIISAYRAAVHRWHPDRNPGSAEALERLIAINRAFEHWVNCGPMTCSNEYWEDSEHPASDEPAAPTPHATPPPWFESRRYWAAVAACTVAAVLLASGPLAYRLVDAPWLPALWACALLSLVTTCAGVITTLEWGWKGSTVLIAGLTAFVALSTSICIALIAVPALLSLGAWALPLLHPLAKASVSNAFSA